MTYPHNDHGFHVPQPVARPGEKVDFLRLVIPAAGSVSMPYIDIAADDIREHAYSLIRVLDGEGDAVRPWDPALPPEALKRGLRAMMLTRAYDAWFGSSAREKRASI